MAKTNGQFKVGGAGLFSFLLSAWAEIKKVRFPTRVETTQSTLGVMFLMFMFALFLGLADYVCGSVMRNIMF